MSSAGDTSCMGLDVGERRIGVAIANSVARIATPLLTLDRLHETDVFSRIQELIQEYSVDEIVVGLPRGLEGQDTAQTELAQQFAKELSAKISKVVYLQDEALTSVEAEAELDAKKKSYQKGDIDKLAATYILRDWLTNGEHRP